MQRSKIKPGFDYAVSDRREWWKHGIKAVQVLDVGYWHRVPRWDKDSAAAAPDTVKEPHRPSIEKIEVPGSIRRGADRRFDRDRNSVLVRPFTEAEDGTRSYGTPYLEATRSVVILLEEGKQQREEYRARIDAELKEARARREALASEEEKFNTRLAAFGAGPVDRNYYSGDRYVLNSATLEMLLTLAERGFEGTREFEPES